MKYGDIVSFRKDLLFYGAVQIGWHETDRGLAEKAAEHFVFHGPDYHGVVGDNRRHAPIDTASFTLNIIKRISGLITDDPFTLAIAGYGTGKSHLGVTLASLFSNPRSGTAKQILENISLADHQIGVEAKQLIESFDKPYIVVTLNGMKDFYLCGEIMRQILVSLGKAGLDTSVLENLRPRFKTAANFTESFYEHIKDQFSKYFDDSVNKTDIIDSLNNQDEDVFKKVNKIYGQRLNEPIAATGQESFHEFITVTKNTFCGQGKPFAGIVILFDEFGRYLEFSVQRSHVAGSGALQQLFEAVQENGDGVFMLGFIQYELKAYISRIAPELRDELSRYVGRYDGVNSVRLSTNLETLIASLFEKKDVKELERQIEAFKRSSKDLPLLMKQWFPEMSNYALWVDQEQFDNIIVKGCWPLHPLSTWVLYKLSSAGKTLQQRSAFSFISSVFERHKYTDFARGELILPIKLCNDSMIDEFLSSEIYGYQGATAHAYESVMQKYQYELSESHSALLTAVLLSSKIGFKVGSKEECINVLSLYSGYSVSETRQVVKDLEFEFAVLEWNDVLNRFEIAGDSVPRKAFVAHLNRQIEMIDSGKRAEIFSQNYSKWFGQEVFNTDFGAINEIYTNEWHYKISFSSSSMLRVHTHYAVGNWVDARGVDQPKGQLIYCYVGPESKIEDVEQYALAQLFNSMKQNNIDWELGVPICILLLHDLDGKFGHKIAEKWVLEEQLDDEERKKFNNFIHVRLDSLEEEMSNLFLQLEANKNIITATKEPVAGNKLKDVLTGLFDTIYNKRIPFPFDGFHTARGNAAKDSQQFTSQLLLGRLDREWVAAQNRQQRNRAYNVFDKSWGVLGEDGFIRIKPRNESVLNIIEIIDSKLPSTSNENSKVSVNMGSIIRLLCAPPYGLNIASAGLVLALYIGRRKNDFHIVMDGIAIISEQWLQKSLSGRFFVLPVLDKSKLERIDKRGMSEWEVLLEEWEDKKTLVDISDYLNKADRLKERMPPPHLLHYRYKRIEEKAEEAFRQLEKYDSKIDEALEKVEKNRDRNDIGKISWGGSELVDLFDRMHAKGDLWTNDQYLEIEKHIGRIKKLITQGFKTWLAQYSPQNIQQLGKFKHVSRQIISSLENLGLSEEKEILNSHVMDVEDRIQHIDKVRNVVTSIDQMVKRYRVSENTPIAELNTWLEHIEEHESYLKEAGTNMGLMQRETSEAGKQLDELRQQCKQQLLNYKKRMGEIFTIQDLSHISNIEYWRREIAALLIVFNGQKKDIEDLNEVLKHFDLIETHIARFTDDNLTDEELMSTYDSSIKETEELFSNDAPPLDYLEIYDNTRSAVIANRKTRAREWIRTNVPNVGLIEALNAREVLLIQKKLQPIPPILSGEQVEEVNHILDICEKRIDHLELEGLVARFKALSSENKKSFLQLAIKSME